MSAPFSSEASPPSSPPPKAGARSKVMAAALAATLACSAWLALQPDSPVAEALPAARGVAPRRTTLSTAAHGGAAAAAAPVAWPESALRNAEATPWPPLGNAARAAWAAPAATAAPVLAVLATAPSAEEPSPPPRFPFTYVGRWEALAEPAASTTAASSATPAPPTPARRTLVLLAGPQRSYAVGAGDLVGDQWRIERVAASSFTVIYLPQGKAQTVSFKPS